MMLSISVMCLAISVILQLAMIIKLERDIRLNFALNQGICTYLHKKYGITVEEMRDIYAEYAIKEINYVDK